MDKKIGNYIKLGLIIAFSIIIMLSVCNIYNNYEGSKTNSSYINKYVKSLKYNELSSAVTEFSGDSFIYISYIGSSDIYDLEKDIRKVLKSSDLIDSFIYVDVTDNVNDSVVSGLKDVIKTNNDLVLPAIVYFKDNKPVDYIDSSKGLMNVADFSQLLDKYEF